MQATATTKEIVNHQRPPVSEAVVDLAEETSMEQSPEDGVRGDSAYLIPIIFCGVALGLILAAILGGIDLSVSGQ